MTRGVGIVTNHAACSSTVADVTSRTAASPADVFADCAAARGLRVPGLTAWTAWETFADFAAVGFGPATDTAGGPVVDPDADALLYQWGTFGLTGRPQFHLVLSRQLIVGVGDDLRGVHEQFNCRLRYDLDRMLSGLGRFESCWVPDGGTAATSWIAEIGGRPEWAVLAPIAPVGVELSSERA
jgi:hypothetical protein